MDFWLVDVQSVVNINGKDVAFDYTSTFDDEQTAIQEAKALSLNEDVLCVSVHHWILNEDGKQIHAQKGDMSDMPYSYLNMNHRELIKKCSCL